jgi:hypothetical protein
MANRAGYDLRKQLSSRYLVRQTKCTLQKTLVRSVLTYGSDSWFIKRTIESMLRIFERRILRTIFAPTEENGKWRST